MALQASKPISIPVDEFRHLHMRSLNVQASGEVDDVGFRLAAVFRRYEPGDLTGATDVFGSPVREKHWMPEDRPGARVSLSSEHVEGLIVELMQAGRFDDAEQLKTTMQEIQKGLAIILSHLHSDSVGTVTVV